ncbi:hypothetical protein BG006_002757 [Podila minutissima]|uniref:Uncharacterized protein n=1 Tax=Podila minutissima TaxID=64525 RepID=A0A9P5SCQ3_9FUNG|nr:hypothetical protein BG006_002757 [Podila minutissima]
MAMNIVSPLDTPSFEPATTVASPPSTAPTTGGLRRNNTLKAYLANKNKIKERQAINVIVDPNVLQESDENTYKPASTSSDSDAASPQSPTNLMSPVSGKRIDTDLDALDKQKKTIEEQLAAITQQLNQLEAPTSPFAITTAPALSPSTTAAASVMSKSQLVEEKSRLCESLDQVMKQRRELLQSWARDYKSLKRSGSLAKRNEDQFWVTTA